MKIREIFIALVISACLPAQAEQEEIQHVSLESAAPYSCVFLTDSRIESLKEAVAHKQEPAFSAFQSLRKLADNNLEREPEVLKQWYVPGYYVDAEGHKRAKNGLRDDANSAYAQALCFRITGEQQYAQAAINMIDAWINGIQSMNDKDDSKLSFSYHFPAFIFAADLLRDEGVWPTEQQSAFAKFLRNKALPMNTMERANNWGNWGLVLAASCAVYLQDTDLLNHCVERWKFFIEHQISADGRLHHEVGRNEGRSGIWYSHFSLMPQTLAAEILKINGQDLYDYAAPGGSTLKLAFETIAEWTQKPESFPYWEGDPGDLGGVSYFSYFEILNSHWPNTAATDLLIKSRPMTATHSAPFLTFTHGQVLPSK